MLHALDFIEPSFIHGQILTSFQKIEEAKYFLDLINENFQDDNKCEYCVSALLSACYSILDHTLEEYRIHFKLKVPSWKLDIVKFNDVARKTNNAAAIGFIRLYCLESFKVVTDPVSSSLLNMRNDNTHSDMNLTPSSTFTNSTTQRRYFLGTLDGILPYFRESLTGFIRSRQKKLFESGIVTLQACRPLFDQYIEKVCEDAQQYLMKTELRKACKTYFAKMDAFVNTIKAEYPRF